MSRTTYRNLVKPVLATWATAVLIAIAASLTQPAESPDVSDDRTVVSVPAPDADQVAFVRSGPSASAKGEVAEHDAGPSVAAVVRRTD